MDGLRGYCAEWNKSEKDKTIWFHLYVEFEKQSKSTNITKQKQSHRFRVQIGGNQKDRKWVEDGKRMERGRDWGTNFQLQNKWVTKLETHTHIYTYTKDKVDR